MERFSIFYRVFAQSEREAQQRAEDIALEQKIEIPRNVVPSGISKMLSLARLRISPMKRKGGLLFMGSGRCARLLIKGLILI